MIEPRRTLQNAASIRTHACRNGGVREIFAQTFEKRRRHHDVANPVGAAHYQALYGFQGIQHKCSADGDRLGRESCSSIISIVYHVHSVTASGITMTTLPGERECAITTPLKRMKSTCVLPAR